MNSEFDGTIRDYLMRNDGFSCGLNMPEALKGDTVHGLPPYAKRVSFLVDEYPACPDSWMRSEGRVKSYFVPIKEDRGMWLDLNENENHAYHVAVVISVQGVNPITGLPCKDAQLEQYIDECPKHKIKFGPDRYCKKCDFKWPKQNYISTTSTKNGSFWLDGFKAADGVVRQYILTAEKMRGVASNVIGKDRVYAVGLSFFISKDKKPSQPGDSDVRISSWSGTLMGSIKASHQIDHTDYLDLATDSSGNPSPDTHIYNVCASGSDADSGIDVTGCLDSLSATSCANPLKGQSRGVIKCGGIGKSNMTKLRSKGKTVFKGVAEKKLDRSMPDVLRKVQTKSLEVGAGAKINQVVSNDPESLDFWRDEPESIICINYCTEEDAKKIIEQGREEITSHPEGYLQDIPVGN